MTFVLSTLRRVRTRHCPSYVESDFSLSFPIQYTAPDVRLPCTCTVHSLASIYSYSQPTSASLSGSIVIISQPLTFLPDISLSASAFILTDKNNSLYSQPASQHAVTRSPVSQHHAASKYLVFCCFQFFSKYSK